MYAFLLIVLHLDNAFVPVLPTLEKSDVTYSHGCRSFEGMILRRMLHVKCRNAKYPHSEVQRFPVGDAQVPWDNPYDDYKPPTYESSGLKNKPWADPVLDNSSFKPRWNELDHNVNRKSHVGKYVIVDGKPRNPSGRTGLEGRGVLGRWGPNHAADPIVTRWKRTDGQVVLHSSSKLPILQFCAIQRRDCKEWAIPGGMVDPGENVSQTLLREFMEEALNSLESDQETIDKNKNMLTEFFKSGEEVYKGYVDDPRNTDNAWMETVAFNFHDDVGDAVGRFELKAGDDAQGVRWTDVGRNVPLYASHSDMIRRVTELRSAHW